MKISATSATGNMEALNKVAQQRNVASKENESSAKTLDNGDVVEISEEGMDKSTALKAKKTAAVDNETHPDGKIDEENSDTSTVGTTDGKSVEETKLKLQDKKSETKRKQKKLEAAEALAEDDPSKAAELHKLENDVRNLKKEEKKLKSEVYSS